MPQQYGRPPQQMAQPMNPAHNGKDFHALLDCISSDLCCGAVYHLRAANQLRHLGLRGFSRLHEYSSCKEHSERMCLEKLLMDRLSYAPNIDTSEISDAVMFTIKDVGALKQHLERWHSSEIETKEDLQAAVKMAASVDMAIYEKLACMLAYNEEEIFRIKMLLTRLDLGQWGGHDIARVSKDLHKHFEMHPDKGLDFDI